MLSLVVSFALRGRRALPALRLLGTGSPGDLPGLANSGIRGERGEHWPTARDPALTWYFTLPRLAFVCSFLDRGAGAVRGPVRLSSGGP